MVTFHFSLSLSFEIRSLALPVPFTFCQSRFDVLWGFDWTLCLYLPKLVPHHRHRRSPSPCRWVSSSNVVLPPCRLRGHMSLPCHAAWEALIELLSSCVVFFPLNFPPRSVYPGLSELLRCRDWTPPPEAGAARECVWGIRMVLLPGLCLSSLAVHGFRSLHLGRSHQSEGVHLDEGISCGMSGKLPPLQLPFLWFFFILILSLISPWIVFNLTFFFVWIYHFILKTHFIYSCRQLFLNTTKI